MSSKAKQIDNDYQMIRTVSMRHAWHPKQDEVPDTRAAHAASCTIT
ncbi:TPA: hypothetical protein L4T46_003849 [Pseudomonas aeruginosa]|nr:hypothetical protein [Pseudomonas aeruginosa]